MKTKPKKKSHSSQNRKKFGQRLIKFDLYKIFLARSDIGIYAKCILLEEKIDINLDEDLVYNYLDEKDETSVRYYLEHNEERENDIPRPRSASEWTKLELKYYSIAIVKKDYPQMFPNDNLILPDKIQKFLNVHSDVFLESYAREKLKPGFKDFSDFGNLFASYRQKKTEESRVDNIIRSFLRKIFPKDFNVEFQVTNKLKVCNSKCKAKTDVSVSDVTMEIANEVIVVENKTIANVTDSLEAQLVAEGIAVTQNKKWKEEWPIYMIATTGLSLEFYKAFFSKKFLKNVAKGFDCNFQTEVFKLQYGLDIDLAREDGRKLAAIILWGIAEECKSRRAINK